ncbi:MAG: YceI family protein [Fimbriimonadaceae bacterium]
MNHSKKLVSVFLLSAMVASSFAASTKFTVGGGRASQQLAQVESAADFETFTGRTDKVTGEINFDPATKALNGKISVQVSGIATGIDLRDEHMRSAGWLDAEKFPTISFETTGAKWIKGNDYRVSGKFTMKGVTKTISVVATVKHSAASDATKQAGFKGSVLQVKTKFEVKLSDYNVIIPAAGKGKVAEKVTIMLTTYGQSG